MCFIKLTSPLKYTHKYTVHDLHIILAKFIKNIRPGRKKNGTRVVIARLNYEIFLWRAHAQNHLRRVFLYWGVRSRVTHIIFTSLKMQYSSWMRVLVSQLFSLRTIRRTPLHFIFVLRSIFSWRQKQRRSELMTKSLLRPWIRVFFKQKMFFHNHVWRPGGNTEKISWRR